MNFRDHLVERRTDPDTIDQMLGFIAELEKHLQVDGLSIKDCNVDRLKEYISQLVKERKNSPERLLAIARYASFHERPELFIYLTSILNSYNILPLIERRVGEMVGNASREVVFYGWERPPLGTPPEEYPQWTSRIIDRMEDELTPEQCRDIMTWNYHQIPEEAYAAKKARYESAPSLDEFLASEHHLLVEELKNCLKSGKVWYEQEVTQEFVDHVASDQRLQTGIRQGDRIIIKKVPFDPKHFYAEKNPVLRRYHYCHCPLARSAIKNGRPRISSTFCYCSAGFTKAPWEVIFDQPVKVEVLKSVLDGDDGCEFAIRIPVGKMK